mgnify:CR=1 FL=1
MFQFATKTALQEITWDWARECNAPDYDSSADCINTADVEVWYWDENAGDPTDNLADQKTYADVLTNTMGSWSLLGIYDNVTAGETRSLGNVDTRFESNDNMGEAASTHFMLAARLDPNHGSYGYDYVKISKIHGAERGGSTPGGGVPVPAPLVLLAAGLPLVWLGRRKR